MINKKLTQLPQSATIGLADRVRRLMASGKEIINLTTGDPNFPTPKPIVRAAYEAIKAGQTHYADSRGLPELRRALAEKILTRNGAEYSLEDEIFVACGGVHALYCGLQAILNVGDEVLVCDPAWMTYANMINVLRAVPIRVPARPENNFLPTLADWNKSLSARTVALIINSPANPTGAVIQKDYLNKLNRLARENHLWVVSDEVYEDIIYDRREHICFASLQRAKDHTLLINSFSKTYAMTGWRVGYLAAPKQVIDNALKASQNSVTNIPPFIQKAAVVALKDSEVKRSTRQMIQEYAKRRRMVIRLWKRDRETPLRLFEPQGAFYFFIDFRNLGLSSFQIAERLLDEVGVALVPGAAFGKQGEGFLRMTIAAAPQDIERGFKKILGWSKKFL